MALQVDVTDKAAVEEMVRRVVAEFGGVDILFNGTGTAHNQAFLTFKEEDFDHALAVGLKAFFLTCQAVGRQMAEQGRGGKIVNLSSIVGRLGSGEAAAWCTTRSGVDAMTRAIAQALGYYGVNVNCLVHGGMESIPYPHEVERAERRRRIPLGRLGKPEDLIGGAIFLASGESDFVAGESLYVDGGYTTAAVTEDGYRPEWARAAHTAEGAAQGQVRAAVERIALEMTSFDFASLRSGRTVVGSFPVGPERSEAKSKDAKLQQGD